MIKRNRKNEELVSDPHELLLSLVDMGSLDADEALLACVTEMSDAECKRVLNSLSLPACCDDAESDDDLEVIDEPMTDDEDDEDDEDDDLDPVADEIVDVDAEDDDSDDAEDEEDDEAEESNHRDLEARLNRLERTLRKESMRRRRR